MSENRNETENRQQAITAEQEDRDMIENVFLPLFDEWIGEVPEMGEAVKLPNKIISEKWGATEESPLALMFNAFCGGIDKGAYIIQAMERGLEKAGF